MAIPVRNEQGELAKTLAALAWQRDRGGKRVDPSRYEVVLLANNCADDSAEVARGFAERHAWLNLHVAEAQLPPGLDHVGTARRLAMDAALQRFANRGCARGIIASTDADSQVAPDWIASLLEVFREGVDAVGGRVLTDPAQRAALPPDVRRLYLLDVAYRLLCAECEAYLDPCPHDPRPRHHQFQGANLAVTAAAYERAGRLPALPVEEDVALEQALGWTGARIRHSPDVRVFTSARCQGRALGGMATQLEAWHLASQHVQGGTKPYRVPSATDVCGRLVKRRLLRTWWARTYSEAAGKACAPHQAGRSSPFARFYSDLGADGPVAAGEGVEVREAIRELRLRLHALRRCGPLPPLEEIQPVSVLLPTVEVAEARPAAA